MNRPHALIIAILVSPFLGWALGWFVVAPVSQGCPIASPPRDCLQIQIRREVERATGMNGDE